MGEQPVLDVGDLVVERIEVVPAASLDAAGYGHGMPELAASSGPDCDDDSGSCSGSFRPEDGDSAVV